MRLGILSIIASCLLATASVAAAHQQLEDAPPPPEPSEPLPTEAPTPARSGPVERTPASSLPTPDWQALPGGYGGYGGYGGWYGAGGDGCQGGCCGSCSSCCCRPSLLARIKALKCKLCAAWACRRACRSCCSSSCSSCSSCSSSSSCCGSEYLGPEAPNAPTPTHLLPTPPVDSAAYDRADGEDMDDASYRPTASVSVVRRQYSMPQAKPAHKTTKAKSRSKVKSRD